MMNKKLLSILILILAPIMLSAQGNQANMWYFGYAAAVTFNQGSPPVALTDSQLNFWNSGGPTGGMGVGAASIADSLGQLQFYSDGNYILNREHAFMLNAGQIGINSETGALIVPQPDHPDIYYFFNVGHNAGTGGEIIYLQYSVIDMKLDNGRGAVLTDERGIQLFDSCYSGYSAVYHANKNDIWVLAHKRYSDKFYAYLVTSEGMSTTPVISTAGSYINSNQGLIKLSPDGSRVGITATTNYYSADSLESFFEILDFDNETGIVSDNNMIHKSYDLYLCVHGLEFSPNSSIFYHVTCESKIYQHNLKAGNPSQVLASEVVLDEPNQLGNLQLGPDGKIYFAPNVLAYLGVINKPNNPGTGPGGCDYDFNGVNLLSRRNNMCLPTFIQTYFKDPEFITNQSCFGEPTQFTIDNLEGVDSVKWKFKDFANMPNDTSTLFSPLYTFSGPGTYYTELTIWRGKISRFVTDTVIIYAVPAPDLGKDTLFCPNEPVILTLNAGPAGQYYWNGNLLPGDSTFLVSDTGVYWVKVNDHNCIGMDTLKVGRYDAATADISNSSFNNSNCNQSDGSITGIVFDAEAPVIITWTNASGNQIGTGSNLTGIPAGSYTATVTFGSGCTQEFGPYDIFDNGAIQITDVNKQNDHCSQLLGSFTIIPQTGNPDEFLYSINGTDYFANGGVFDSLSAGAYTVTIKNQSGCISAVVYDTIADIPGPDVNCIAVAATGTNADGSITVISAGMNLTYQLEGFPAQTNNTFGGLTAGTYYLTVTDEFGCPTLDTVIVESTYGSLLVALADKDRKCLYKPANSEIKITRVNGLKDLKAVLYYNDNILNCTYFNPNNSDFPGINATLYSVPPRIEIMWNGFNPLFNTDTLSMGTLIFETLQSGIADINWEPNTSVTWFLNQSGDTIQPVLIPGTIEVHEIPEATITGSPVICEGDDATLEAAITGGTEPVEFGWQTPGGLVPSTGVTIENAGQSDEGIYTFTTRDYFRCADTVRLAMQVVPLPTANFPEINDSIWYEQTYLLEASQGYASYEWNTGEDTYFITITSEGQYSVILQTEQGCKSADTVMMMNAVVPIYLPNAFTPNGDGLNEVFRPVVDRELVKQFTMSIYNKWGQKLFETNNANRGWDGDNAMPGVYSWMISYENRVGKIYEMKGTLSLIK